MNKFKELVYQDYQDLVDDMNDAFPDMDQSPEMYRSIVSMFRDYFGGHCPPFEIIRGKIVLMQADLP